MARTEPTQLLDDVDGTTAVETVTFAIDGEQYEINLSAAHARALRDCVNPFLANARRLPRRRTLKDRSSAWAGRLMAANP